MVDNVQGKREVVGQKTSASYFGLHIPATGLSAREHQEICNFFRRIIPKDSKGEAKDYWIFNVTNEGVIEDIPRDSRCDRNDLPFRYPFAEVYDHLWTELSKLGLSPGPPLREAWNADEWYAASRLQHEIQEKRATWIGLLTIALSTLRICAPYPVVVLPPHSYAHDQGQMARLQKWIDERIADHTLLLAIRTQFPQAL